MLSLHPAGTRAAPRAARHDPACSSDAAAHNVSQA